MISTQSVVTLLRTHNTMRLSHRHTNTHNDNKSRIFNCSRALYVERKSKNFILFHRKQHPLLKRDAKQTDFEFITATKQNKNAVATTHKISGTLSEYVQMLLLIHSLNKFRSVFCYNIQM